MSNDDLNVCDREPIHLPGMIQPHGYCCSYDVKSRVITSVSANISAGDTMIGKAVTGLIPLSVLDDLVVRAASDEHEDIVYEVALPAVGEGYFDIAQIDSGDELILEIFPREVGSDYHECNYKLAHSISRIMPNESIEEMCRQAAREMKRISGFDRVMLYRFDPDYNGSVIAEEKEPSIGSYLGLHFPADDIPRQARELYRKQTVRIISDVSYAPVDLLRNASLGPLDMTYSQLRSVSPIHIEYLQNMNVAATLTVSILVEGKLWGLIACHHYSPRHLTLRHMELIRTFGLFFSGMIEARVRSSDERRSIELRSTLDTVVRSMQLQKQGEQIVKLIDQHKTMFASLLKADGFVFSMENAMVRANTFASDEEIREMIGRLRPHLVLGMFATSSLVSLFPDLDEKLLTRYAGVMMVEVKIAGKGSSYWLWHRREKTKTLHWGGDPNNRMTINEDGRIQPRQSFEAFKQIVPYRSDRWESAEERFMPSFIHTLEGLCNWHMSTQEVSIKEQLIREMEDEKSTHYRQLLESLVDMIEQRDAYTAGHTMRVALYCDLIARELDIDEGQRQLLYEAAVLHDIGKLVVPDAILLKPGKLSKSEFDLIRQHLTAGYEILKKIDYYRPLAEIIRYHHEKFDGTGYLGFKGEAVPIESHILIVADAIDAMTSNRIYQARRTMDEALDEVMRFRKKWYHPDVADAAVNALASFSTAEEGSQMPLTPMEQARFSYYFKDQLTGLYNEAYLDMVLNGLAPDSAFKGYVMVRTYGMSAFNNAYGWHAGDELLRSISEQISEQSETIYVFRVMGDDFVVACREAEHCIKIMKSIDIDTPDEINMDVGMVDKKKILAFIQERE